MGLGDEQQAEACRSPRRRLGAAAVGQRGPAGCVGQRRHPDGPTVDVDLLPGPQSLEQGDALLDEGGALAPVDAEHGELLGPVADADHVGDPAPADQVDDRHVLCELDRLVQGQQESGHVDGYRLGPGGDGGGQRDR